MSKKIILKSGMTGGRGNKVDHSKLTHKECSKCLKIKPVQKFSKSKSKTFLGWVFRSYCKDCGNQETRLYGIKNREKRNQRLRKYRKDNPEKIKLLDKRRAYKRKYGLTLDSVEKLKSVNGYRCWICQRNHQKLFVDHCHNSNKIRGMLCPQCNTYLGTIKDSVVVVENLKKYLSGDIHADVLLEIANTNTPGCGRIK